MPRSDYLKIHGQPETAVSSASGPFFVFSDGRALTRERFVIKELRGIIIIATSFTCTNHEIITLLT